MDEWQSLPWQRHRLDEWNWPREGSHLPALFLQVSFTTTSRVIASAWHLGRRSNGAATNSLAPKQPSVGLHSSPLIRISSLGLKARGRTRCPSGVCTLLDYQPAI